MPKRFLWLACLSLLLLNAIRPHAQSPIRETKPRNCSISGRVTIKGKPAINATVLVTSVDADQQQAVVLGQAEAVFAKTLTDGEGRYQVLNLPPGEMLVRALSRAYVATADAQDFRGRMDMSVGGKLVSLRSGDQREGIDFDFVRGGVITGRVTESGGRPVPNEFVNLLKLDEEGKPQPTDYGSQWSERKTDDRGSYRLFGLPAGRYVVFAGAGNLSSEGRRQQYSGSKYLLQFYPDAPEQAHAKVLEVIEGGELTDIDLHLVKAGKAEAHRTFVAKGRVLDAETGKPVAKAEIHAAGEKGGAQATTDAQGAFQLNGLPSGKYQLNYHEPNPFEQAVQPGYYADPLSFEIGEADANGLAVRLQRGATISGVVVIEGQRLAAGEQTQTLMINARTVRNTVSANRAEGQPVMEPSNFAMGFVKAGGQFNLNGLRPGWITFEVGEMLANAGPLRLVRIERSGANLGDDLEIAAKEQMTGVRVIVQRLTGVLRGQINFAGAALPKDWARHWRLNVTLTVPGTAPPSITQDSVIPDPSGGEVKWSEVDETGRFEFRGLQAGSVVLSVIASPAGQNVDAQSPFEEVQQSVFINAQGETNVTVTVKVKAGGRQ